MRKTTDKQDAPSATPRSEALSSIWQLILTQDEMLKLAPTKVEGSLQESFKIGNDLAHKIIKTGIPSKALEPLGKFLGLSKSVVASYVELDRSTVNRLVSKDQLLPIHAADTVLRFLELDGMAAETFATEAEASAWLRRSHRMLDGEAPLAAAQTSFGGQRAKDILLAVKYGGVA